MRSIRLPLIGLVLTLLLCTAAGQAVSGATVAASSTGGKTPFGGRMSLASSPGADLASHPAPAALSTVQVRYLAASEHGMMLARRYWGNQRYHWFNALLNDRKPYPQATIWDIVPVFESVDEISLASPTTAHKQTVISVANHAEQYWDKSLRPGPGYAPYPDSRDPNTKTYFDDNSWLGLAFMDAYRTTGNVGYLSDAERAMHFVIAYAWDQAGGGGLWWNTEHPWRSGEALGAATDLAARLYQVTRKELYLRTAERYIRWANHNLLKWDGSYAAWIPNEAIMPHDGEGALVASFTTLCQTGAAVPSSVYNGLPRNRFHANPSARLPATPSSWCSWAESLADKTAFGVSLGTSTFDQFVPLNEGPQWDAIYVRGLLELYSQDHNPRWYNVATATATRILQNAVDSSGRFLKAWNGSGQIDDADPGMLRTHGASVSVLAALAVAPPPGAQVRRSAEVRRSARR